MHHAWRRYAIFMLGICLVYWPAVLRITLFWGFLVAPRRPVGKCELWCRYVLFVVCAVGPNFLVWFLITNVLLYGLSERGSIVAGALVSVAVSGLYLLLAYKGEALVVALRRRLRPETQTSLVVAAQPDAEAEAGGGAADGDAAAASDDRA